MIENSLNCNITHKGNKMPVFDHKTTLNIIRRLRKKKKQYGPINNFSSFSYQFAVNASFFPLIIW